MGGNQFLQPCLDQCFSLWVKTVDAERGKRALKGKEKAVGDLRTTCDVCFYVVMDKREGEGCGFEGKDLSNHCSMDFFQKKKKSRNCPVFL